MRVRVIQAPRGAFEMWLRSAVHPQANMAGMRVQAFFSRHPPLEKRIAARESAA